MSRPQPPAIERLPDALTSRGGDPQLLKAELVDVITTAIADAPRSKQRRIGPSEIGSPCQRRLGYKLAGVTPVNDSAAWRPTVGTAVHSWLEQVFSLANRAWRDQAGADVTRWLVEHKVAVGDIPGMGVLVADNHDDDTIMGRCDLYDRVTATSIDWKVVGPATLKRVKAGHIDNKYRVQGHAYGHGWTRRNQPVDTVAVMFLPSNGELSQAHMWHEPYDTQIVADALARVATVTATLTAFGPERALPVLSTADDHCQFCPYRLPAATDVAEACPGHPAQEQHNPTAAA